MNRKLMSKYLAILFFAVSLLLVGAEYFSSEIIVYIFKPMLMPLLLALYWLNSTKKCKWYLVALLLAFLSNVFLLFPNDDLLLPGIVAFLFYRIATIVAVIKNGDPITALPVVLATIPFLVMFSYLVLTIMSPDDPNFFATLLNDVIISIFCGIGLSSYFMNDNVKNSWLIISTLLSTFLVVIFMFDKFYLSFQIFKPLSAFIFSMSHYAFYRFMIEPRN